MDQDAKSKARYWELFAAADAAWKRGDMAEWERLVPLVGAAMAESGIKVHRSLPGTYDMFRGGRPEDN